MRAKHIFVGVMATGLVAVALVLFRVGALTPTIDLATTPADLTVYGAAESDFSGIVSLGDLAQVAFRWREECPL